MIKQKSAAKRGIHQHSWPKLIPTFEIMTQNHCSSVYSVVMFYVNEISVIYVTTQMCRRTEEKVLTTAGFPHHRHFIWLFNVPVQAPTRGHPFYGYSEKPPHLVAFYDMLGIRRTYTRNKPRGP